MLELIFQGFIEWVYGITLECWEYFSSALLDIMSLDFAYLKTHVPVINDIMQILLAAGWALLIGNLVFQALKSMVTGLGFEGEDPKLLFTRTFVFSFLLLASPQICEMGLNITSNLIALLEIPDAVNVALVDESAFGALTVSWLLVIIFDIIIMFKVFKLILEIAERYVILAMLTITAPLAFGVGGSRNTSEIFTGWCRMFGSMCLLMVTNVIFFKMLLSVLSSVPSGLDTLPWMVLVVTIVKVAKKADAIITRIGLNPAITGDGLGGRSLPGMLTYTVVRTMAQQVVKTAGKSIGGSRGQSGNASAAGGGPRGPRTGPTTGGAHFTGTAGMGGRPSGAASQSSQQTNTAQNTTAQNSQTQGGGTTQVGPQQTETRQQTTSTTSVGGTNSESRNNTTHRSESTRRSSVTPGARRGTSYMKNGQPGATGADLPGGKGMTAQAQPGMAQPRTGAEGTGTPRSAPGIKTWREGSAGISREPTRGRTAGGTTGMRTDTAGTGTPRPGPGTVTRHDGPATAAGTAGTAPTPPSRFTAVTTQRVNEGDANSRVTASEQNNVSVGQPGQSQRAATDRQHSVKGQRQPPNPTGQGSTKPDSTVTRYTSRKIEKTRTSVPVSPAASAPNPTP
ncbi:MAG: conjugal transfer protein TrbL family protein, partial [Faecousia sp.]